MEQMESGNTTVNSTGDAVACDYLHFVNDALGEVHDAKALVAGANSLLHDDKDSVISSQVVSLLLMLRDKLESINTMLDESSFEYEAKIAA